MSKLSVVVFLPCLLFSQIGPLASWENLQKCKSIPGWMAQRARRRRLTPVDWIVVVYSLLFQLISLTFGLIGTKLLRMPKWIMYVHTRSVLSRLTLADPA